MKENVPVKKNLTGQRKAFSSKSMENGVKPQQQKYITRYRILVIILPICLVLSLIAATMLGSVSLTPKNVWNIILSHIPGLNHIISTDWTNAQYNIVWEIRFPRVLLGAIVGGGLSLAGTGIQALVRNSLAEPYILGVSSGASVGATLVILTGLFGFLGQFALPLAAFLGALLSVILVFSLAQVNHKIATTRLLLSGIALSLVLSAITDLIVISSPDNDKIHSALFWMMGSLTGADWKSLPIAAIIVIVGFVYLLFQSRSLNILLMGEETAATLGLNINVFRKVLILVISLLTGVLVSVSGAIGFLGLMIPHLTRLLVGPVHKRVLTISLLFGATFLIWADVAARLILAPEEIPIGVITAITGGPFFIWLLRKNSYSFGN